MHSVAEISTNVPAFLAKLWKMIEDPITDDLIAWSSTGTSFVIKDEIRFARELLPMYYKHNNMASFIRQLNMYGFHKIVSPDAGSMKMETQDEIKFMHPFFLRGHPYLLDNIKRKIGVSKTIPGQLGEKTPQVINKVLTDVRQMKGRQESLDSRLTAMKMENGALWRELSLLRQKHIKQQQIVNKLIQFLVTIVQQNHTNFTVKRQFPRMLQHHDKSTKYHEEEDAHGNTTNQTDSPVGPVIHEIDPTDALLETVQMTEETESDSQEDASEYFLDRSEDTEAVANEDLSTPVAVYNLAEIQPETIIGMPEDTLVPNSLKNQHDNNSIKTKWASIINQKKLKKHSEAPRPKYLKFIARKQKKNADQRNIDQRQQLIQDKKQLEMSIQKQIEINQKQIEINQQQIKRNEQQQIKKNQKQQLLRYSQQQSQKNQQQVRKSQQLLLKNQELLQKKRQEKLLEVQQKDLQRNKQLQSNLQEDLLIQRVQEQPQSAPSEQVITIPFDSGGKITAEVDNRDIYVAGETEEFNLPVVIEVNPLSDSSSQTSPCVISPQDLLISSPVVVNDPVMTPKCEPVVTPIVTPGEISPEPSSEMQVACVEEPQVTSPNLVSRTEMDNHVESVQSDLENLKELLRSEGISLDANTLLGYFSDDLMSYNMPDPVSEDVSDHSKENNGNELMAFNPPLLDFTDIMGNDWSLPASPSEQALQEDSFAEVNTPQFVPQSPSFPTPAKKRKK